MRRVYACFCCTWHVTKVFEACFSHYFCAKMCLYLCRNISALIRVLKQIALRRFFPLYLQSNSLAIPTRSHEQWKPWTGCKSSAWHRLAMCFSTIREKRALSAFCPTNTHCSYAAPWRHYKHTLLRLEATAGSQSRCVWSSAEKLGHKKRGEESRDEKECKKKIVKK